MIHQAFCWRRPRISWTNAFQRTAAAAVLLLVAGCHTARELPAAEIDQWPPLTQILPQWK